MDEVVYWQKFDVDDYSAAIKRTLAQYLPVQEANDE
jgi:hypothetical protein